MCAGYSRVGLVSVWEHGVCVSWEVGGLMVVFTWIWQVLTGALAVACIVLFVLCLAWGVSVLLVVAFLLNTCTFSIQCWLGYTWRLQERGEW